MHNCGVVCVSLCVRARPRGRRARRGPACPCLRGSRALSVRGAATPPPARPRPTPARRGSHQVQPGGWSTAPPRITQAGGITSNIHPRPLRDGGVRPRRGRGIKRGTLRATAHHHLPPTARKAKETVRRKEKKCGTDSYRKPSGTLPIAIRTIEQRDSLSKESRTILIRQCVPC